MKNKDRIIFFNIPPQVEKLSKRAIQCGLKKVRSFLKVSTPVEMLVLYDPNEQEKDFSTDGGSLSKRAIFLNINIKIPFSTARLRQFESTTAHEYVHCLRADKKIKTLLDAIINEGISSFVQTSLYGPPNYMDIQGTHVEDIRKWWRWWHKRYLVKSINTESSMRFLNYRSTREGGYRLGYYIVSNLNDSKKLSLQKLINSPFDDMKKFTFGLFRKNLKEAQIVRSS